jgi:hypothetical protein
MADKHRAAAVDLSYDPVEEEEEEASVCLFVPESSLMHACCYSMY